MSDTMEIMDTKDTIDTTESVPALPLASGRKRGFAALSVERRRAIARQGGQTAHAQGAAHKFTPEEAREAGRKGGRAVSQDRQHMAMIARKGGLHSRKEHLVRLDGPVKI